MTYLEEFEIAYEQHERDTDEYLDEDFLTEFHSGLVKMISTLKLSLKGNN